MEWSTWGIVLGAALVALLLYFHFDRPPCPKCGRRWHVEESPSYPGEPRKWHCSSCHHTWRWWRT